MKKLLLSLMALFVLSLNGNAQSKGWAIAGADAAGALGGAASAITIINFLSLTPPGWFVIGGGAIIGGVGSSLAVSKTSSPSKNTPLDYVSNPNNQIDYVGQKHNAILSDYLSQNSTYLPKSYLAFINKNLNKYDIKNEYIDINFLVKHQAEVMKIENFADVIKYTLIYLPKEISKSEFESFLNKINDTKDLSSFISTIKSYENQIILDKTLSDGIRAQMSAYFSTLRYSGHLWY